MKRQRATVKGGRKRTFKTNEAYRQHIYEQVKSGLANRPDGSWGPKK